MNIIPLFPTLIFKEKIEIPDSLVSYCLSLPEKYDGVKYSNRGGYHSPSLFHDEEFGEKVLKYVISQLPDDLPVSFGIDSAWINISNRGDYNLPHDHPGCDYAMVVYIKTPENCGDIIFQNPCCYQLHKSLTQFTQDVRDRYNSHIAFNFKPEVGDVYIFPSHIEHSVNPNESDETRISLSCNLSINDLQ